MNVIPIALGLLLVMTAVIAQEDLPKQSILPDNPLYGLKTLFENVQLALTFSQQARIEKQLELAERRLAEAQQLVDENKTELAQKLTERYQERIGNLTELLNRTNLTDEQKQTLTEKIANRTVVQYEHMSEIIDKVNDSAKEMIIRVRENILNRSQELLDKLAETNRTHAFDVFGRLNNKLLERLNKTNDSNEIDDIGNFSEHGIRIAGNDSRLQELIANATQRHIDILREKIGELPPNAQTAIIKAIGDAERIRERLLNRTEDRLERPIINSNESETQDNIQTNTTTTNNTVTNNTSTNNTVTNTTMTNTTSTNNTSSNETLNQTG